MPHLSWGILSVSKPPDRRPNRRGRVKMVNVEVKSFSTPDTIKELPEGTGEARTVEFHTRSVTQLRVYPGWQWSKHIKPHAGTESCQVQHLGVITQGRLTVRHDDGTEASYGSGDAYSIMPGHDVWVEGDEIVEGYEFADTWTDSLPQSVHAEH
jgi:hypothetical protein